MSKFGEQLRTLKIHNTHGLLMSFGDKGRDIALDFSGAAMGRCSHTSVWSPRFKTSPDGPWYSYGNKQFAGKRAKTWPLAMAWAVEQYGALDWVPGPFGGHVPRYVIERAKAALRTPTLPNCQSATTTAPVSSINGTAK